jgi:thiosulfate/3-mercaptopyruvate sulfurtransferase
VAPWPAAARLIATPARKRYKDRHPIVDAEEPTMSLIVRLLVSFAAALPWVTPPASAADLVVGTEAVEAALQRGAIVWDVRPEEDYRKGHVPGAVNIDDILVQLRDAKSEDYLPVREIEKLLGEAGIDPSREIVLYGAKASTGPYFGLITLEWLGGDRVSVYHGGIDDWKAAGKAVATEPTRLPAVSLRFAPREALLVSTRELLARLDDPDVQIVDARTAREFDGDDIRALRGGHIPRAVNIPYESNWVDPDTPRKLARKQVSSKDGFNLKSPDELQALYGALDPEKETIVYCQSGVRASYTATMLQALGFRKVRVYDSSWLAYGNQLDAPAESVSYFNVARVNGLLNTLQARIDDLEAEIAEVKKAQGARQ